MPIHATMTAAVRRPAERTKRAIGDRGQSYCHQKVCSTASGELEGVFMARYLDLIGAGVDVLHQPAMHLEDQTEFGDIPWPGE